MWADDQTFPAFKIDRELNRGGGAGNLRGVSESCLDFLPIGAALQSRCIPAGYLLQEAQGQEVLAIARRQAAKLKASMRGDGGGMSDTTEQEAISAGVSAVVAWRNGAELDGAERGAAGVCWRAILKAVASDSLGDSVESIEAWRGADDSGADCWDKLTGSALPLPPLCGDCSHEDRLTRLLFEQTRAKRPQLLARRIESLKLRGGRGKRAELIDKLHRSAVLLLHGESVDKAAIAAGFRASGQTRAGDYLFRAVRRLGFHVQFTARDRQRKETVRRGPFEPLSFAVVSSWSCNPSATLKLQNGRGDKQRIPAIVRLFRGRARRARLAVKRAAWSARSARQAVKRRTLARAARRIDKAAGWFAVLGKVAGRQVPSSRTNGYWRGSSRNGIFRNWR
ncbi:MAG: hypothetical protein C5B50_00950 [Verrucomicrobia bacterium]|nr:MAG: hypothetical protein C5B50_00950 [Verrucomicrobiota bacterium]